jgi:hypothetical protein
MNTQNLFSTYLITAMIISTGASAIFASHPSASANDYFTGSKTITNEEKTSIRAPAFAVNGYARTSAWGGSDTYRLNTLFAEISLQGELKKDKAYLQTDLRLRRGYKLGQEVQTIEIKSLIAGIRTQALDLQFGYQNIAWGRTDGFNPTNHLQSHDYFFLSVDPNDQRIPTLALRTRYRLGRYTEIDLIAMPVYCPSVYRYDLFQLDPMTSFTTGSYPLPSIRNGSIAGRFNIDIPGLGASLSAFRGYDPYHGFRTVEIDWSKGMPQTTHQAMPYRKTSIGADIAIPTGSFILKSEAAWNITKRKNNEMHIPETYWMYVGGIETKIGNSTLITNYIGHLTPAFKALEIPQLIDLMNPAAQQIYANALIEYESRQFNRRIFHQQKKNNHALSITWLQRFAYDSWEAQLTVYHDLTSGETLARPSLKWAFNDYLSFTFGGQYLYGEEKTLFHYSSSILNGVFAEIKVYL